MGPVEMVSAAILFGFYFVSAIAIFLGLLSLRGGVRFVRYLQSELETEPADFTPYASVFIPCRGLDRDLKQNVTALFAQDYPLFELIFVSDQSNDPAFAVIEEARQAFAGSSGPTMRFVNAGAATHCGQKVHNLRVAATKADPASEVFVFVDTDARPHSSWLRFLVAPLSVKTVGAATGYRWFVPVRGGFASHLRSVWNAAIASALGANEKKNFCWGGSTAIRRRTFAEAKVLEYWRGTVSDDFALTRALQDAGFGIRFVPQCLTPSFEDCTFRELIEFTTRQLKVTHAYAPHLWKAVLFGSLVFVLAFFGGTACVIGRALMGQSFATPLFLVLMIFALGAVKSHLRLRAVLAVIGSAKASSFAQTFAHVALWPVASALYLHNAIAAFSRRITWRGITYELKSANETVIIRRDDREDV
jgi:ceramide glucosyltransferase